MKENYTKKGSVKALKGITFELNLGYFCHESLLINISWVKKTVRVKTCNNRKKK